MAGRGSAASGWPQGCPCILPTCAPAAPAPWPHAAWLAWTASSAPPPARPRSGSSCPGQRPRRPTPTRTKMCSRCQQEGREGRPAGERDDRSNAAAGQAGLGQFEREAAGRGGRSRCPAGSPVGQHDLPHCGAARQRRVPRGARHFVDAHAPDKVGCRAYIGGVAGVAGWWTTTVRARHRLRLLRAPPPPGNQQWGAAAHRRGLPSRPPARAPSWRWAR